MRLPDQNTLINMSKSGGLEWIQNFACLWHHLINQMKKNQILYHIFPRPPPAGHGFDIQITNFHL